MDPRTIRTDQLLDGAVLQLASERCPSSVSMSEIAARAGIQRTTAYARARTPIALLAKALRNDLDALYEEHLDSTRAPDERAKVALFILATLQHVERHERVYLLGLSASEESETLQSFLRQILMDNLVPLVSVSRARKADAAGQAWRLLDAARWPIITAGLVAVIQSWLATPGPRSYEDALDAACSIVDRYRKCIRRDLSGTRATPARRSLAATLQ